MQAENNTMKMSAKLAGQQPCAVVNRVMGFQEWALIVILSILWGGSFLFIGVTVKEMPPLTIVAGRVSLAAVLLWAYIYLRGWNAFVGMGLIFIGLVAIDGRLDKRLKEKKESLPGLKAALLRKNVR